MVETHRSGRFQDHPSKAADPHNLLHQCAAIVADIIVTRTQGVGVRLAVGVSNHKIAMSVIVVVVVSEDDPPIHGESLTREAITRAFEGVQADPPHGLVGL
jgi:hypothetical protein